MFVYACTRLKDFLNKLYLPTNHFLSLMKQYALKHVTCRRYLANINKNEKMKKDNYTFKQKTGEMEVKSQEINE